MIDVATQNKLRNMSIVCAAMVVVIHCRPAFEVGSVGWWVKQMLEAGVCHVAVPFFFVVSGYFLSRKLPGMKLTEIAGGVGINVKL